MSAATMKVVIGWLLAPEATPQQLRASIAMHEAEASRYEDEAREAARRYAEALAPGSPENAREGLPGARDLKEAVERAANNAKAAREGAALGRHRLLGLELEALVAAATRATPTKETTA